MMNKQGQRLLPVAPPLVEMMDLVTTDDELEYLLIFSQRLTIYPDLASSTTRCNIGIYSILPLIFVLDCGLLNLIFFPMTS
jgi:hypothetical protein